MKSFALFVVASVLFASVAFAAPKHATPSHADMNRKLSLMKDIKVTSDVSSADVMNLELGQPMFGNVERNQYQQYTVTIPIDYHPIIEIDVIPFEGDPDCYVTDDGSTPTTTNYQYYSITFESEYIAIKPTDSKYCDTTKRTCTVNVGIYGFSNATYMIWAATTNTTVDLTAGIPFTNLVFPQKPRNPSSGQFYKFYAGNSGADVIFQTTTYTPGVLDWELELFVSTKTVRPSITNSEWRSIGINGYHYPEVSIEQGTTGACYGCWYYLGVYGPLDHPDGVVYSMLATNGPTFIRLPEGLHQNGHATSGDTVYYEADIDSRMKSTSISVKATYGDPDIFVTADGTIPSPSNFMWRAQRIGDDMVTINGTDPLWRELCLEFGCDVHIAVRAFQTTTYSIVFNSEE